MAVTDVYGYPLAKALKIFRVLCCAGKYLADALVGLLDRSDVPRFRVVIFL